MILENIILIEEDQEEDVVDVVEVDVVDIVTDNFYLKMIVTTVKERRVTHAADHILSEDVIMRRH